MAVEFQKVDGVIQLSYGQRLEPFEAGEVISPNLPDLNRRIQSKRFVKTPLHNQAIKVSDVSVPGIHSLRIYIDEQGHYAIEAQVENGDWFTTTPLSKFEAEVAELKRDTLVKDPWGATWKVEFDLRVFD